MDDQSEVVSFLASPSTYGTSDPVEHHETHGSHIFLSGERAYKLKRAVRYPYMDYSTADKRRDMCEIEVSTNRRTAPQLYLGVRAIRRGGHGGLVLADANVPDAVDWVVEMRRFSQEQLLENVCRRGEMSLTLASSLAERIAEFHRKAEIRQDAGGSEEIGKVIAGDIEAFRGPDNPSFEPAKLERWARLAWRRHGRDSLLLDRRRDEGFVRRCHGDLHLNNICLIDNVPVLFDAIEFNERFTCIDTLYDLAFLLMDLDHHGLRPVANRILNRYIEKTHDHGGLGLVPLFLSCRAAIRAHVTAAAARVSDPASASGRLDHAERLLDQAIDYLARPQHPCVVAIGGLSGTGKSTLAGMLAPFLGTAPGAIVLRSDVVRKQMMGVDEDTHLPPSAYSNEVTVRVYDRIAEISTTILEAGYTVIADAVYGRETERARIEDVARLAEAPFFGLWLVAEPSTLESRIESRRNDPSDATVEVLRQQSAVIHAPASWARIDASGPKTVVRDRAQAVIRGLASRPADTAVKSI